VTRGVHVPQASAPTPDADYLAAGQIEPIGWNGAQRTDNAQQWASMRSPGSGIGAMG
jgi:hypothetical protein